MSGHSKWHSIKHKKGALDAKRGKIFTKHAKLITIAARDGGGDPEMNPGLRTAIANAKADNVPNANIEKAIKKGSGEDKDSAQLDEIMYEGFGPNGTMYYIHAITDNKNRTVASVKTAFNKNGGNMGEAGTVGYMFEKKGMIIADIGSKDPDEAELEAIDAGAQDLVRLDDAKFEILTAPTDLAKVRDTLEEAGFEAKKCEFDFRAKQPLEITEIGLAKKVLNLMEALEEDDDVANIYVNFEIADEIAEQI